MRGVLTKDESASSYYGLDVIIMTTLIQGGGQGSSFLKLKASKAIDVCISESTNPCLAGISSS